MSADQQRRPRCTAKRSDGERCRAEASHVSREGAVFCGMHAPDTARQPPREAFLGTVALRRAQHPAGTLPLESLPLLLDALPASCRPAPSGYPAVRALLEASPRRDVLSAAIEVRLGEGQRRLG